MTSNNYRTLSNYNEEISSCQQAFITGSPDILYPLCPAKLTKCSKNEDCVSEVCCGLSPFPGDNSCTIDQCYCSIHDKKCLDPTSYQLNNLGYVTINMTFRVFLIFRIFLIYFLFGV